MKNKMFIIFRTDAYLEMSTGHVMRRLTLANNQTNKENLPFHAAWLGTTQQQDALSKNSYGQYLTDLLK